VTLIRLPCPGPDGRRCSTAWHYYESACVARHRWPTFGEWLLECRWAGVEFHAAGSPEPTPEPC